MRYLKLFEQFDEEESWWDEESPFDNIIDDEIRVGDVVEIKSKDLEIIIASK